MNEKSEVKGTILLSIFLLIAVVFSFFMAKKNAYDGDIHSRLYLLDGCVLLTKLEKMETTEQNKKLKEYFNIPKTSFEDFDEKLNQCVLAKKMTVQNSKNVMFYELNEKRTNSVLEKINFCLD